MNIRFILVEPKVPENIGASARAIKTMGFGRLDLVKPAEWKEGKALWVAHGSGEILESAGIYNSLSDAIGESDFVIATSAKPRSVRQDYIPVSELSNFLKKRKKNLSDVAVVFGREESGLTNDEIRLGDIISSVPMAATYPSLNLSQAVMIYAWELSELKGLSESNSIVPEIDSVAALKRKVKELLAELGIDYNDNRYGRILERVSFVEPEDLNLLHSVISSTLEKLARDK